MVAIMTYGHPNNFNSMMSIQSISVAPCDAYSWSTSLLLITKQHAVASHRPASLLDEI
jgi:hypothetical protein